MVKRVSLKVSGRPAPTGSFVVRRKPEGRRQRQPKDNSIGVSLTGDRPRLQNSGVENNRPTTKSKFLLGWEL